MTVNATQKAEADLYDFHEQLKTILPRLRVYALSLTRDRDSADDLVHDTVVKALTGRKSFQPARTSPPGSFAFSATNSSPACAGRVRRCRSTRSLPTRCRILLTRRADS